MFSFIPNLYKFSFWLALSKLLFKINVMTFPKWILF